MASNLTTLVSVVNLSVRQNEENSLNYGIAFIFAGKQPTDTIKTKQSADQPYTEPICR
jgi:hypothetical protein